MKREDFYFADLYAHRRKVHELMTNAATLTRARGLHHDVSKFQAVEAEVYAPVVWELAHDGPAYGTPEYHELVKTLGPALEHHREHNDHHPEHFKSDDPLAQMDLFQILEMLCDWAAAASRHGGDPLAAMKQAGRKYPIDPQVKALLTNTMATLCGDEVVLGWTAPAPHPTPTPLSEWAEAHRVVCPTGPGLSCIGKCNCTRGTLCQTTPAQEVTPAPCIVNAAQNCEGYEACTLGAPCEGEGVV